MPNQQQDDLAEIKATLFAARHGGASVSQLARAHELAEKYEMPGVVSELRRHVRNNIPDPMNGAVAVGRTVGLGVISGLLTFFLVRGLLQKDKRQEKRRDKRSSAIFRETNFG